MSNQQIYNESYCEVYLGANNILYAKWKGFLRPNDIRNGCSVITEYIHKNNVKLHLSDHRELRVLSKESQEYLVNEWFSEVEKKGLKKVAALVSPDAFAKASVERVNNQVKVGALVIDTFENEKSCIQWLLD